MKLDPAREGIDHVNAYSKSSLEIGRALSNFAHAPFQCEDGYFASMEGYWYWLLCKGDAREQLRNLYSWQAKNRGRALLNNQPQEDYRLDADKEFQRKICSAFDCKLNENTRISEIWWEYRNIPVVHYYWFGNAGTTPKVVVPRQGQWLWDHVSAQAPLPF